MNNPSGNTMADVSVVIIGAGLSGICAAYHMQQRCPDRSFRVIEARDNIGGTWDLFKYPGIRSDSDMYTFGYNFKPWTAEKAIAPADTILKYMQETVDENGLQSKISFGTRLISADRHSESSRWTLTLESTHNAQREEVSCDFLFCCTGYYRYSKGYTPDFPGVERYRGTVVHPQNWPESLDCTGKRVTIIGSGATAVTLAPTLAKTGAKITLLQRSPTWIMSMPDSGSRLFRFLPDRLAHALVRWRNIVMFMVFYQLSKRKPEIVKRLLLKSVKQQLRGAADMKHFTPGYEPWDQRVCLVPNGDLFKAIRNGDITMVTDHIEAFDETGIRLESGERIDSDIVITATGLTVEVLGGASVSVDNKPIDWTEKYMYKGTLLNDVPNFAFATGYTNASWTLKTELVAKYVCRLLNHMERNQFAECTARLPDEGIEQVPLIDLQSGYVLRANNVLPKQGNKRPWRLYQNYLLDRIALSIGKIDDDTLHFERQPQTEV